MEKIKKITEYQEFLELRSSRAGNTVHVNVDINPFDVGTWNKEKHLKSLRSGGNKLGHPQMTVLKREAGTIQPLKSSKDLHFLFVLNKNEVLGVWNYNAE